MGARLSITVWIQPEEGVTPMLPVYMWAQDRWEWSLWFSNPIYLNSYYFWWLIFSLERLCLQKWLPWKREAMWTCQSVCGTEGWMPFPGQCLNKSSHTCTHLYMQCMHVSCILSFSRIPIGHLQVSEPRWMAVCVWGRLRWWRGNLLWHTSTGTVCDFVWYDCVLLLDTFWCGYAEVRHN